MDSDTKKVLYRSLTRAIVRHAEGQVNPFQQLGFRKALEQIDTRELIQSPGAAKVYTAVWQIVYSLVVYKENRARGCPHVNVTQHYRTPEGTFRCK